jgi:hypothetical protein
VRARNIKPGFFVNEDLAEIDASGRLLFIGLWCLADREGKLEDRPKRIKGEIFRFDGISSQEVDALLNQLHEFQLIIRYEVDGVRFIQIPNFLKHQRPHYNEKPSSIPNPLPTKVESACDQGDNEGARKGGALRSDSLNPDSLNPDYRSKDLSTAEPPTPSFSVQDLAILWNENAPPELAKVNLPFKRPPKTMAKMRDAIKRNHDRRWWERVLLKTRDSPFLLGVNDRGWKASFDFMIENAEVILDGKYDGGKPSQPKGWGALKESMQRRRSDAQ